MGEMTTRRTGAPEKGKIMSQITGQTIALIVYFLAMILIGWWGYTKTKDYDDYMLAGRRLHPIPAALSAGASDMSGWLLMGLPGAIYAAGLVEGWIAVGLTIGQYLNWKFIAPRLRSYTEIARDSITIPSFFNARLAGTGRGLTITAGIITLVFFIFYISSQLVASGKYFESAFGWDYIWGMLLIAGIVVLYTFAGGFIAVAWTDMAQGLLMMAALLIVPVTVTMEVGGPGDVASIVNDQVLPGSGAANGLDPFAGLTVMAVLGAIGWGMGYVGQPHIIVRFMALRTPQDAVYGRRIGISWMVLSVGGAILTAIVGISYFQPETNPLSDPETVFIALTAALFHPLIGGLILAAVLAAIMSTISSQLLVSSSAMVEDVYSGITKKRMSRTGGVRAGRIAVLITALIAAAISITPNDTVLNLVGFAWAGFGSSFGPIVLLALFWKGLTARGAMAGMITGAAIVIVWGNIDGGIFDLYEMVPAFLTALLVTWLVSRMTPYPADIQEEINTEFDQAVRLTKVWDVDEAKTASSRHLDADGNIIERSPRSADPVNPPQA